MRSAAHDVPAPNLPTCLLALIHCALDLLLSLTAKLSFRFWCFDLCYNLYIILPGSSILSSSVIHVIRPPSATPLLFPSYSLSSLLQKLQRVLTLASLVHSAKHAWGLGYLLVMLTQPTLTTLSHEETPVKWIKALSSFLLLP